MKIPWEKSRVLKHTRVVVVGFTKALVRQQRRRCGCLAIGKGVFFFASLGKKTHGWRNDGFFSRGISMFQVFSGAKHVSFWW